MMMLYHRKPQEKGGLACARYGWLAALTVLLLSGCGHREDPPAAAADTAAVVVPRQADTACVRTDEADGETDLHRVQRDTAENLNAGLFSKKEKTLFSAQSLHGEWVCGTLHEEYFEDGTGRQWDTRDDVSREEAQTFQWRMEDNVLRQVYTMQLGAVVPRIYNVTFVDDESLVYKDDLGTPFMWDRQKP